MKPTLLTDELYIAVVYVGYPGIPFISFDQVILPKYEANAKMGKKIIIFVKEI